MLSVMLLESDLPVVEAGDGFDKVFEGSSEPVEAPDDQAITRHGRS